MPPRVLPPLHQLLVALLPTCSSLILGLCRGPLRLRRNLLHRCAFAGISYTDTPSPESPTPMHPRRWWRETTRGTRSGV
nr:unnamed protein product [Digitaria exilis]